MRALIAQDSVEKRVPLAEVLTAHTRCQEQILFERAQQWLEPNQPGALAMAEPISD